MPFTVPDFNLVCDVYTGPWLTKVLRVAGQVCALAPGRRRSYEEGLYPHDASGVGEVLLLPAYTDVRDASATTGYDVVECPAGTNRWYFVGGVDDSGKGHPNEYRRAAVGKVCQAVDPTEFAGAFWPSPIP